MTTPCDADRRNGMPVEFLPKDERSLQGHQGPHSQAPDVEGCEHGAIMKLALTEVSCEKRQVLNRPSQN